MALCALHIHSCALKQPTADDIQGARLAFYKNSTCGALSSVCENSRPLLDMHVRTFVAGKSSPSSVCANSIYILRAITAGQNRSKIQNESLAIYLTFDTKPS